MFRPAIALVIVSVCGVAVASDPVAESKKGMVVCVSPAAAEVGVATLKAGGNAVDAAVAVGFAEAVTWPEAGNIGGGGFMLVWPGNGKEPVVIDYRETAPAAATEDMFAKGVDPFSAIVAGVPGTVRGFALAHQKFGKLPWKDVVLPAVKLAEEGFPVTAGLATRLNKVLADPKTKNREFRRIYGKPSGEWSAGDVLKLPDLGKTLRSIAETGPDAFYTGDHADKLVAEMKAGNGLISAKDLQGYHAKIRTPIHGTYRGYDIYAPPPPSSGGVAVVESLNILENFDLKKHPRHSPETTHLLAEAMRRSFADRARHLGDPDFSEIPAHLTTKEHAKKLAAGIDPAKATPSADLAGEIPLSEGDSTTHFSVADGSGMAVSNTYTLENAFGNRIVVRGAGYILNNEMTDFNPRPGVTTRTGIIGTKPNRIAPGKRMLSSQCPTIVAKDGKPVLVTGSPGGRTIINTVLCVVVNTIDYDLDVRAAVDAPRMHQGWFPDRISHEDFPGFDALAKELRSRGHTVGKAKQGDAHSIAIDPKSGVLRGAADSRLDGKALGW